MTDQTRQLAEAVEQWHANRMALFDMVLDQHPDAGIKLGDGDDAIELTGEQAKGFRTALAVAKGWWDELPFSMEVHEDEPEDDHDGS